VNTPIKLFGQVDAQGHLQLDVPELANTRVEIQITRQVETMDVPREPNGLPVGFFEALDAMIADDLQERPDQGQFEVREPWE
jgi:hypothetical protein